MKVDSITNGVVIDHIRAGFGLKVIESLRIDTENGMVAVLMNVPSQKYRRKDIIKVENLDGVDVTALGLIDHNATVCIIKDGEIAEKITLELPVTVTGILRCKNPRCVTSAERVPHIFHLAGGSGAYRCEYCDEIVNADDSLR